jgi:cytochrome bd-type quinol oxidase subunit 2
MVLESVWFFLWGLLWAVYFMTDGFDLGIGSLLPFLGKTEEDKRVMVNAMGPLWDGNQVWLLSAGGVTFAAFPRVYAVVFLGASYFTTRLYANYMAYPLLFAVILLTVAVLFGIRVFLAQKAYFKAWFASALTIVGATFYGVIGLFPNMFPSSLNPAWNLTAHNASSSQLTLTIMLVVVIIFVPIVLAYQAWAYNLFKSKITPEDFAY